MSRTCTIVDAGGDEDANGGGQLEHDVEASPAGGVGGLRDVHGRHLHVKGSHSMIAFK